MRVIRVVSSLFTHVLLLEVRHGRGCSVHSTAPRVHLPFEVWLQEDGEAAEEGG